MRLDGKTVVCLLDTGCHVTLVPQSVVLQPAVLRCGVGVEYLEAVNGTQIAVTGKVILPFRVNGQHTKTRTAVSADTDETMLGADWFGDHRCAWYFVNSIILLSIVVHPYL